MSIEIDSDKCCSVCGRERKEGFSYDHQCCCPCGKCGPVTTEDDYTPKELRTALKTLLLNSKSIIKKETVWE